MIRVRYTRRFMQLMVKFGILLIGACFSMPAWAASSVPGLSLRNFRWAADVGDGQQILVWDHPGEKHRHFICALRNGVCRQLELGAYCTRSARTEVYGNVEIAGFELHLGKAEPMVLVETNWQNPDMGTEPLVYEWSDPNDPSVIDATEVFWNFFVNEDPEGREWLKQLDITILVPRIQDFVLLPNPDVAPAATK